MEKKILVPLAIIVVLGIGVIVYSLTKEDTPSSQENNQETVTGEDSENDFYDVPALPAGWKAYSSSMGMSFQYPEKIMNKGSGCEDKDGYVPVKVFEDKEGGALYIAFGCSDTLATLKADSAVGIIPSQGRQIEIMSAKNDGDIDSFLKSRYGSGCYIDGKEKWFQEGVLSVKMTGEDWDKEGVDLGNTTCSWGGLFDLLYIPASQKLVYINLGQEAVFCGNGTQDAAAQSECFDGGIIGSLRFN
jgi:hypothetical protein